MAKYQITGPDGHNYEVSAPDDASQEDVLAHLWQNFEKAGPAPSALESFGRGAIQGATFGFSDEMYGGAKGLYDKLFGSGNFTDTYTSERDAVRAANDRAQEENPTSFFAGELGGGIALPGGAAKLGIKGLQTANVARTASLASRSATAAKEGALLGGLYGLGKGEGDVADQAKSTVVGAVGGGAVGGAIPGALQIGSAALRVPANIARQFTATGPSRLATEKFAEAMSRDAGKETLHSQLPTIRAANRVAEARAEGDPMILADFGGENTKNLLRAASNMPNAATERFNQVLNRRQALQGRRLSDVLEDTLSGGKDFMGTLDDLVAERAKNATPAFKKGYDKALTEDAGKDLDAFFSQRDYAGRLLEKTMENVKGMSGQSVDDLRPYEMVHRVKMQINREIGNLKRGIPDSVANWNRRDLEDLNGMLGRMIEHHNPELGSALKRYSDQSSLIGALEDGSDDFFKLAPEELAKKIKGLSADEQDLYRIGAARAQVEKLRAGDVMRDRTKSVYGSDDIGLRLKAVFPEGPQRGQFLRAINNARKMTATRRAVQGNSTTAKQLTQGQEAGKAARTIADAAGVVSGKPGAIISSLERGINVASGITPSVAEQILKLGMLTDASRSAGLTSRAIREANRRVQERTVRQGLLSDVLLPLPGLLSAEYSTSSAR